jgi:N-acetyl-gamma-glutamyl-phosphate reductase
MHRHEPEIKEKMKIISGGVDFDVNFVPHLLPLVRGEMCDIYTVLKEDVDPVSYLKEFYKNEKFIRVFDEPVQMKSAAGTNFCDIFVKKSGHKLYICSVIDNILKGSSSGAVVNANIMSRYDEDMGIPTVAYVP